jgi:phage baseplate assembly protein W|tara:strand:- start:94 stop:531 length:438 start_codon:yes stop_codon:yes gene_type:complete
MPILDRRNNQFVEDQDTRVSVGIDFPFGRVPNQDGYFKTTKTTIESVKNNIRLLLKTEKGERLFQPNLGLALRRFLFQQINEDTNILIENEIVDTFEKWLPFVEIQELDVNTQPINSDRNQIKIKVTFNIRRAPGSLESVGVVLG